MDLTPWIAAIIATAVVFASRELLRRARNARVVDLARAAHRGSFHDVVRHPELLPDLDEIGAEIKGSEKHWRTHPEEIPAALEAYAFGKIRRSERERYERALRNLGPLVHPHIEALLADETRHPALLREREVDGLPASPFTKLCEVFDPSAPPPATVVPLLLPFLTSSSEVARKRAGYVLGTIADPKTTESLRHALRDESESVRSYVLMGLEFAAGRADLSESTRALWFEVVSSIWPADSSDEVSSEVPRLLLALDRMRGQERLVREDALALEPTQVRAILDALNELGLVAPRPRLLKLLADVEGQAPSYARDSLLREILTQIGGHREPEDRKLLEEHIDADSLQVVRGACAALRLHHRLDQHLRPVIETELELGWDALNRVEQHLHAVWLLDMEIQNGGLTQYFFNSAANTWPTAREGLRAIGAMAHLEVLESALALFPQNRPSTDRKRRSAQLAKLSEREEGAFDALDRAWGEAGDAELERRRFRYDLAHPEGRAR